jgi:hypothetical protein
MKRRKDETGSTSPVADSVTTCRLMSPVKPTRRNEMNKTQRKQLEELRTIIIEALEEAQAIASGMGQEEQDKFDNLSEGLQQSERGQALEQAAEALSELEGACQNAMEEISASIEQALEE